MPVTYTRDQMLAVRHLIRLEASAADLGIRSLSNAENRALLPLASTSAAAPAQPVAVVKKKAKARAASSGDAMAAAGYYSTKIVPPTAGGAKPAAAATTTAASAAASSSVNVWEQRKLLAQEKAAKEKAAAKAEAKKEKKSAELVSSAASTTTSSSKLSLAEEYAAPLVSSGGATSSFSADDRAKLAQLREHLKNRTLASQLRPIASEFRPSAIKTTDGTDPVAEAAKKKHWSRDWTKGLQDKKDEEAAAPASETQPAAAETKPEETKPAAPTSWAQRARTVSPAKVKAIEPVAEQDPNSFNVVGSNEDRDRQVTSPMGQELDKQQKEAEFTIPTAAAAQDDKKKAAKSRSPSKRRVPPPKTIGQLRQRNEEDLPVDFRDLIPTTDVTGKAKPMSWKEQRDRMKNIAKILLNKNQAKTRAASADAGAQDNAIDQINARATTGTKARLPTFREHQASRAKSAIVRPLPTPTKKQLQKIHKQLADGKTIKKRDQIHVERPQSSLPILMPVEAEAAGPKRTTLDINAEGWSQYIPDIREFPQDYAALFADWSYADMQAESRLHKLTEDVKLLENFQPEHLEVIRDPETGLEEEYSMMWVEGTYRQVPLSIVTPELIRKSKEAQRIYEGVDAQNLSLKRAFIQHKKGMPALRKERKEQREAEIAELRKKIERTLETGLDQCDRKAAEVLPLAKVMKDSHFEGLTLRHKSLICRARRVHFLKTERLVMVERVAQQHSVAVLDVIAVLHAMMSDRVEQKNRKHSETDEIRFARMLAKRDNQMNKLAAEQKKAELDAKNGIPPPQPNPQDNLKKSGPPVQVQPLEDSEEELRKRIAARKKHIQIAMRTPGYQIWEKVKDSKDPKYNVKLPVHTPIPEQLCSKRAWDGLVRQWRQRLHQYDHFAPEILGRPVYAKEEVEAHRASAAGKAAATPTAAADDVTPVKRQPSPIEDAETVPKRLAAP